MKKNSAVVLLLLVLVLVSTEQIASYPIDGYALTGIRRLERLRLILAGELRGTKPVPGAQLSIADLRLNLVDSAGSALNALPPVDPVLQGQIDALFPNRHESYSLALLEITPGKPFRFASRHIDRGYPPGSVGKIAIATGLFAELKAIYPDEPEKRRELLRTRMVKGGRWVLTDHHEVPIFNPETRSSVSRAAREDDVYSLYEWIDHMLSASANSAASVVWKEAMLMRAFGASYPPSPEQELEFFAKTPKNQLTDIAIPVVNDPLRAVGIAENDWRLGSFFTRAGKEAVPGRGGGLATPLGLLTFLVAMEQGKVVDRWSSLEIKRLLYMTARRIRYASSPALADAAVYFKSGSQYRCKPEPDFKCGKYMGNVDNYMNSVAIVEHGRERVYLVALMSNVLRKNSAVEHQTLATYIDRILAK